MNGNERVAKGKAIVESGKYAPERCELLGRIEAWGIDVYEGSPQEWKDALTAQMDAEVDT